ncbi:MAG: hypothetical protein IPJ88_14495 [Myxococcales bacterium]|nr:MAG: hypothetical protein IPJ88_14495 [Myxococcales bacterium]
MIEFDYQGFLAALAVAVALGFLLRRWSKKDSKRKGPDVPVDQLLRKHRNDHKRR